MTESCDVLIIGAGPAGLAAAIELARDGANQVVVLEAGRQLRERRCPVTTIGVCPPCKRCDVLSGVGGASGVIGGKLCFFPAGDRLASHTGASAQSANERVLALLHDAEALPRLQISNDGRGAGRRDVGVALTLKPYTSLVVLEHAMVNIFTRLVERVSSGRTEIRTESRVETIQPQTGNNGRGHLVSYRQGYVAKQILAREAVIVATGRSSAPWSYGLLRAMGVSMVPDSVDVGIRLEIPEGGSERIVPELEDPKLKLWAQSPSEVRTLCWCRGGEITVTHVAGATLVDGHFGVERHGTTSVSIVARMPVPDDVHPLEFGLHRLGAARFGAPLVEDLLSFMGSHVRHAGQQSLSPIPFRVTESRIGQLLPEHVHERIADMIDAMNTISRGRLLGLGGRVFAPVVDKFWGLPRLDRSLMTELPGLYVVGDLTGLGRGIVQGLFSGLVAAQSVSTRREPAGSLLSVTGATAQ